MGTEVSPDALAVAQANCAGLGRVARHVTLLHGSWFDPLPDALRGTIDVVVSNPPYVAADDDLPPEVSTWEPLEALVPGRAVSRHTKPSRPTHSIGWRTAVPWCSRSARRRERPSPSWCASAALPPPTYIAISPGAIDGSGAPMIVPTDEAFSMTMAALRRGAIVVIPTDTVYGIAARADDPKRWLAVRAQGT